MEVMTEETESIILARYPCTAISKKRSLKFPINDGKKDYLDFRGR